MDAELYTHILKEKFLQSLESYGMEVGEIIFRQDDPKHLLHCLKWLTDDSVEVLDWPVQSPDLILNPIEHLWQHLKGGMPPQVCIDLIESMPRCVAAVLKAKGRYT
ncbi:4223_t:CDS:2 [Paraglomus occultum]|uniref:4223_t:CDS:1 n=1 Tax=Paraglomus occultum TaxID=144539 RepID=A0A9N8ZXY3_9GLOM|nr:4223_t:CDS:2 [Paraglomus occultum]